MRRLRFDDSLWALSKGSDLLFLATPLAYLLVALLIDLPALLTYGLYPLSIFNLLTEVVFGGTSHITVTALLLIDNRKLRQGLPEGFGAIGLRTVMVGLLGVLLFWGLHQIDPKKAPLWIVSMVGAFALHHNLAQCRGFFALYEGRNQEHLGTPADPSARRLLQWLLDLILLSVLAAWIFTPGNLGYHLMPWPPWALGVSALLILTLAGFLLFHLGQRKERSGPQVLYVLRIALYAAGLLYNPFVCFAGLSAAHGVEYILLVSRLVSNRAASSETPSLYRRFVVHPWGSFVLILLALTPGLFLVLVQRRLRVQRLLGDLWPQASDWFVQVWIPLGALWVAVSFMHYYLDRQLFRFRFPSLRAAILPYVTPYVKPNSGEAGTS